MASKYKTHVAKFVQHIFNRPSTPNNYLTLNNLVRQMKIDKNTKGSFSVKLPATSLLQEPTSSDHVSTLIENFETDDYISSIAFSNVDLNSKVTPDIHFCVEQSKFVQNIISQCINIDTQNLKLGDDQDLLMGISDKDIHNKKIVIDFSSPNVAKPFHMGHLRSTIIGNFIANINEELGNDVVRLNYLGDWGTQFGFLAAGLKRHQIEDVADLSKQLDGNRAVIKRLHEIYVDANITAASDLAFNDSAKREFAKLEKGDASLKKQWKFIRDATIHELDKTYKRINVRIDVYHGESMYGGQHDFVRDVLTSKGLLAKLEDGREVVRVSDHVENHENSEQVVITKSDGSSLYITRDIAAAIDRQKTFHFDKILYVVEKAQSKHFSNLFQILKELGYKWSNQMQHIEFGRIQGMSSRKGNAVLLSDILDEAKGKMIEQQNTSINKKVDESDIDFSEIADMLAISAVICNDLKQKRGKDYQFDWKQALHSKGDSGIKLQYTHARLTSLLSKMLFINPDNTYIEYQLELLKESTGYTTLIEKEALELIYAIAIFEEVIKSSYSQLEPCILVNYLFRLCNTTSKALKTLEVKNASNLQIAHERMALFAASRAILRKGMHLLGITPLNKI